MGYMDSTTSTITSTLTTNDGSFRITKFKLGDNEINYQLYVGNIDSEDLDILSNHILEPSTNPDSALRFPLVTLPEGTKRVAELTLSPANILLNLNNASNRFMINVNTLYNQDPYYLVSFNQVNRQYVNSISVAQYSNEFLVNNQSSETAYEWTVKANSTLQFSEAKFNTVVSLRILRSEGEINTELADSINDVTSGAVVGGTQSVGILLFTMIVMGNQSGAFTTLDVYGQRGGRTIITPNPNQTADSSNVILGGNS